MSGHLILGVSLLLMSTVAFIVLIYQWSTNPAPTDDRTSCTQTCCCFPNFHRRTLLSFGMALICGLILVFWYMVCFALWIAGSYLAIVTIKQMRVLSPNHSMDSCNLSVVGVASASIIFIWVVFFSFCCSTVYAICNNNFLRREEDSGEPFGRQGQRDRHLTMQQKLNGDSGHAQQKLNNEHIYDPVPTNEGGFSYNIYDTVSP